ncbi:MAG: double-strand break repair protein AddB, partial [Pseudomonadota bacterium]|nr:double-strand break repair protein AddB [Pseudomonadota bacterium]
RKNASNLRPLASDTRRVGALRSILQPPEATAEWSSSAFSPEGLRGIHLLAADTLHDEARMIAVALREALETPGKTAALVTPDRQLARMVAAQMQRFGIAIDDSAGRPLKDTPPACFMRLVSDMAASCAAPVPLLSLLRHPFAAAGLPTPQCRRLSRLLETDVLRGIRRAPGLEALRDAARHKPVEKLLASLAEQSIPLMKCFSQQRITLRALLEAHMQLAEWLASTDETPGAARLWAGDDGNQLAAYLAELLPQAELLPPIDPLTYPGLFETLLSGQLYRPRWGLHPRLHILSPIEARLLHFNRVILGGLNEGTWPPLPEADPWMSRPMRDSFGLPPAERGVGQSAHDFYMLAAAPEVILSRSRKVDGMPTVPSRWLVRLETLAAGHAASLHVEAKYGQGTRLLDTPLDFPPLARPEPAPPLAARPRRLSVTAVDAWLRDPYMVYARYILRLKKLEALDEDPDAADFGMLVHGALEKFVRTWPEALPDNPLAALLACGREAFAEFPDRPAVACLWWPRFEAMAAWLTDAEKERRGRIWRVAGEVQGEWQIAGNPPFTLTARIDRLETGRDGSATIIDYKTGTPPSPSEVERGLANQLPLEALTARHGGLISGREITLEYWRLAGNPDACEIRTIAPGSIAAAEERLLALIARFDNAATSYAAEASSSRYNDYEHLARRQEWEMV